MSQDTRKPTRTTASRRSMQTERQRERRASSARQRTAVREEREQQKPVPREDEWTVSIRNWDPERSAPAEAPRQAERSGERRHGTPQGRSRRTEPPRPQSGRPRREEPPAGVLQAISQKTRHVRRRWRRIVREKRNHRFPESERISIQLLLFIWSMLPMLGSRIQERVLTKNQESRQKSAVRSARAEGRRGIHPVLFLGGGCAAAAVILFFSMYTMGTTVTYNGRVIASVSSEEAAEEARTDLERVTAWAEPSPLTTP